MTGLRSTVSTVSLSLMATCVTGLRLRPWDEGLRTGCLQQPTMPVYQCLAPSGPTYPENHGSRGLLHPWYQLPSHLCFVPPVRLPRPGPHRALLKGYGDQHIHATDDGERESRHRHGHDREDDQKPGSVNWMLAPSIWVGCVELDGGGLRGCESLCRVVRR
jgi:hypothetical protein